MPGHGQKTVTMARPADGASGDFQGVVLLAAAATRFANVVTSFLSSGSLMSETAFPGSTHCVKRCSNSGHVSVCLFTNNGKTLTSQFAWMPCSSSILSQVNRPIDFVPIFPLTPASSKASRAADFGGLSPLIGQPFGMIQRLDVRVVTRRISSAAAGVNRYGSAAYWMRRAGLILRLFGLRGIARLLIRLHVCDSPRLATERVGGKPCGCTAERCRSGDLQSLRYGKGPKPI
jgi:hypothetical protein